ncbi:hypothetical protein, partial [Klebsiella pneumoniae]|uniref:hypothetical protein n=1 Tax=Klebsiella pneumoniae TaxID=573 RepID=UPI000A417BA8
MMDYQTAVRGAFFDIAGVAETPDEVAAQARYLDDGLLAPAHRSTGDRAERE